MNAELDKAETHYSTCGTTRPLWNSPELAETPTIKPQTDFLQLTNDEGTVQMAMAEAEFTGKVG